MEARRLARAALANRDTHRHNPQPERNVRSRIDAFNAEGRSGRRILSLVADGQLYGTQARALCADIVADYGDRGDLTSEIAKLGSHGANAQNILRELLRRARRADLQPVLVKVTLKKLFAHGTEIADQPVLYPHEVLAVAFKLLSPDQFATCFLGTSGAEGLRAYWHRQRELEWVRTHPGFLQPDAPSFDKACPIYIHADKGQHIKHDKMLVISWGSVLARTLTCYSLFLFTVLPCDRIVYRTTEEELYRVLVWSVQVLMKGVHPHNDHTGQPWPVGSARWALRGEELAGGLRLFFAQFIGDWEWCVDTFGWRGYRHNFMCHRCWASKVLSHMCYTNFGDDAFWRTTIISHTAYMLMEIWRSSLEDMPGWRLERTRPDSMHTVNLGLLPLLIGNVLLWLVTVGANRRLPSLGAPLPLDADKHALLHDLYLRFKLYCRDHGLSATVPRFSPKSIYYRGTVCFNCKAAPAAVVLRWLNDITSQFADIVSTPDSKRVAACTWGLMEYMHVVRHAGHFLTPEEQQRVKRGGGAFLHMYTAMHNGPSSSGSGVWCITPKFHMFQHILIDVCENAIGENPTWYHCFSGEDMVGKAIRWAVRAHAASVASTVLQKYIIYLLSLWSDMD